jgi:hypothetical protein
MPNAIDYAAPAIPVALSYPRLFQFRHTGIHRRSPCQALLVAS